MDQIKTRTAEVSIMKENFVRMVMLEDARLELQDMMDNHAAERTIMNEKPHVVLIDTRSNSMSSDEARKFSSGEEPAKYRIAVALLFDGLPGRIVANSLIRKYNPVVPTKKFTDEADAVQWLENEFENWKKKH